MLGRAANENRANRGPVAGPERETGSLGVKRPLHAHVLAGLAALALVVAVGALWLLHYRSYPRGTGFDDLTGVFVPFVLLILTGLWLIIRALLEHRLRWRSLTVFITALAFALAPVVLYCGPVACFAPGPNRFMGWFVVIGVALGALVHHLVLKRLTPEAHDATRHV